LVKDCKKMHEPLDTGREELYFHTLKNNRVKLTNPKLKISCSMEFDSINFPYLVEWKNLFSGCYVLGLEPTTTKFKDYKKIVLTPQEKRTLNMSVKFEKI
ncbi:MAG: DUF4432 family protein, partial [Clostridia bacterium]|nr:DUF4432 family protein [Clostridia bacterium]